MLPAAGVHDRGRLLNWGDANKPSRPQRLLGCLGEGDDHPAGAGSQTQSKKRPPPACKLRKARARVFVYTRHNRVRLVIRYVAFTKATITTSYTMHGKKGNLFLGQATSTFNKKGSLPAARRR